MKNKVLELLVPSILSVVLTVALCFPVMELARYVDCCIHYTLKKPNYHPNWPARDELVVPTNHIRTVGYSFLAVVAFFVLLGFVTEKRGLTSTGAIVFFLPIFGYFAQHMFFLTGLGILRILWLPFWGNSMHLGNIVYLPYLIIIYPFVLMGVRIGALLPQLVMGLGFLLFLSSIQTWLRTKLQGKVLVDSWVYRFSRHPQYLAWLVWSYGLMLYASRISPVRGGENPGAGLPWAITSLIIICVALSEEIKMKRALGEEYDSYRRSTPFMLPIPKHVSALIKAPLKLVIKKERPENRIELMVTFMVYLAIIIVLSLPFLLLGIPGNHSWVMWP